MGTNIFLVTITQGTGQPIQHSSCGQEVGVPWTVDRRFYRASIFLLQHGIRFLVTIVVVEELVIIICIGQFKWHRIEEHIELVNGQQTIVQFNISVSSTALTNLEAFLANLDHRDPHQ